MNARPESLSSRTRRLLLDVYVFARLAGYLWISLSILITESDTKWAAHGVMTAAIGLFGAISTTAWLRVIRATDRPSNKRLTVGLCALDQALFTAIALVFGRHLGIGPLIASIVPPMVSTALTRGGLGILLAAANTISLACASFIDFSSIGVSLSEPRAEWPIYCALSFVYCIPIWMIFRLCEALDLEDLRLARDLRWTSAARSRADRRRRALLWQASEIHERLVGSLEDIESTVAQHALRPTTTDQQRRACRRLVAQCAELSRELHSVSRQVRDAAKQFQQP
jgi:hypothetical protein